MCGIVAVMRRGTDRPEPVGSAVLAAAEEAREITASAPADPTALAGALDRAGGLLAGIDRDLRGGPGLRFLIEASDVVPALDKVIAALEDEVAVIEAAFDRAAATLPDVTPGVEMESINAGLIRLKDLCWAIRHDRLQTAAEVAALAGRSASPVRSAGADAVISRACSAVASTADPTGAERSIPFRITATISGRRWGPGALTKAPTLSCR